jgi:hypothetical protein
VSKKHVFVVISGKKRHGKNYFADRLKIALRKEFISFAEEAFANPMKRFCADVFGIPIEDMETEAGKAKNTHLRWSDINKRVAATKMSDDFITVRELLQILGTEVFREGFYGPIWAEAPFRKTHKWHYTRYGELESEPASVVIITDCRFPNEVVEAKKNDAIIVRVVRESMKSTDEHVSETALDNYTWDHREIAYNYVNDECFDDYIEQELMPKIKGQLYGH